MILTVAAWFYQTSPDVALEIFRSSLKVAGFRGVEGFSNSIASWDCLTLDRVKVFAGVRIGKEQSAVEIKMRGNWDDAYPAFQRLFADLLSQHHQFAELLASARNPQVYAFLTHPFYRDNCPVTLINGDEEDRETNPGDEDYWRECGPELHFIRENTFDRARVDVFEFASRLNARILPLAGGTLLDCGWTQEFELPEQVANCLS